MPAPPAPRALQPMLHDLVVCLAAPTTVLGGADGQIRAEGAQGVFHADVRVLSRVEVRVGGYEPEAVSEGPVGPGAHEFVALLRQLGDDAPDPTVRLDRHRQVTPGRLTERLRVTSMAAGTVHTDVVLTLAADFAAVAEVKLGGAGRARTPHGQGWRHGAGTVTLGEVAPPARVEHDAAALVLRWSVEVPARGTVELSVSLLVRDTGGVVGPAAPGAGWDDVRVDADDRRVGPLVARCLADLSGLRMVTRTAPDDAFLAAGSPWYLTLFGRDSLWAARLLLPYGTALAGGTLRTLAARQGRRHDPVTQEEPGKILHELRRPDVETMLPAQYYGTVDATALWVLLLHDAWRWGLPPSQVQALLDPARRALDWLVTAAGDGFLEYVDHGGGGLSNQGWKDSRDSIRFADGRLATAPIALAEVQGYAYAAAVAGAALLAAFGVDGAPYTAWAGRLADRFRDRFWVTVGGRRYPALALAGPSGDKVAVDALTSNIGHLLGTGLLSGNEEARVAALVGGPDLDSGYGLRTMAASSGGYSPLSYHCGSVWPHDTAIVVDGLARAGRGEAAAGLIEGVLAAADGFDGRLPELYSGEPRAGLSRPVPYPAACRPQAWSAAAPLALVSACLGIGADVPAGRLHLRPVRPGPLGRLTVAGLRVGGDTVTVRLDADGDVLAVEGTDLEVHVQ